MIREIEMNVDEHLDGWCR